jgi:hypothetical protein
LLFCFVCQTRQYLNEIEWNEVSLHDEIELLKAKQALREKTSQLQDEKLSLLESEFNHFKAANDGKQALICHLVGVIIHSVNISIHGFISSFRQMYTLM